MSWSKLEPALGLGMNTRAVVNDDGSGIINSLNSYGNDGTSGCILIPDSNYVRSGDVSNQGVSRDTSGYGQSALMRFIRSLPTKDSDYGVASEGMV